MKLNKKNGSPYDFGHLNTKGLTITQAQNISNLCNQRNEMLESKLNNLNNYSAKITDYTGNTHVIQDARPVPGDIDKVLSEMGENSALQAFLMDNLRKREEIMNAVKDEDFEFDPQPKQEGCDFLRKADMDYLTVDERIKYLYLEAKCARIGSFIHKNGQLTILRKNVDAENHFQTYSLEVGKQIPVVKTFHHTSHNLLIVHEKLSETHRELSMKLNYFKAKIKNARSEDDLKNLAKLKDIQTKYAAEITAWTTSLETKKKELISQLSQLRIELPQVEIDGKLLIQPLLTELLKKVDDENDVRGKVDKEESTS